MKKLITILLLGFSSLAFANPHGHHGHHRHWHPNYGWVIPAIIGGTVVYAATRPQPVVIQQPVYVQPNQVVVDGVVYTKQIMVINGVQQEVLVRQ